MEQVSLPKATMRKATFTHSYAEPVLKNQLKHINRLLGLYTSSMTADEL